MHKVNSFCFSHKKDQVIWSLHSSGKFSVKSLYNWLYNSLPAKNDKHIWKAKIPLKIKLFA
jgi:hypothetical protein